MSIKATVNKQMCSTPFGIKDQFGLALSLHENVDFVLNAFRHQRSVRPRAGLHHHLRQPCSTPFGIKDQFGSGKKIVVPSDNLCSTPFGIKDQFG